MPGCDEVSSMSGCVRVRLFALSAFIWSLCAAAVLLSCFSGISPVPALMQNTDRNLSRSNIPEKRQVLSHYYYYYYYYTYCHY